MTPKIQRISILSVSLVSLLFFIMLNNAFPWPIPDSGQTTCYNLEKEIPCQNEVNLLWTGCQLQY